MRNPIYYVFKKELIEIRRSRIIGLLVVAPILQMIVFGYVATTDIKHVETMVCDEDNSALSRQLISRLFTTEYFDAASFTRDPEAIQPAFSRNQARMAVRIPKGFSADIKRGKRVKVQLIVDGSDSNMASIALNRGSAIIRSFSGYVFAERLIQMKNRLGNLPSAAMEERVWYNPELKSAHSMVPGVAGLILLTITLVVTSLALVREKESGNIEQLMVSPLRPYHIIAGKILPYAIIGLLDVVLVVGASILVFGLSFRGSFPLLVALSVFMVLANLGMGIFISTVSSTQQQAMLSDIFILLPNMLLSGFIFPIKNMPEVLQWFTYLIPLRYYIVIIRGIFLKGLTFMELLPQITALLLFSVVVFVLSIIRFRKKLS